MKINLKAYRFSETELKKMNELRHLFADNNLVTDRFPEVYYDDIEAYEQLFGKIENTEEEITPDYLGVYQYSYDSDRLTTKEGIIVLFKNRIENFCKSKSIDINKVRLIVLVHELGHWLTHWAELKGKNWKKGFGINNLKTHESLAQLVAYWAIDGNPGCERILKDNLTPKDQKNAYALYKELIAQSKSEILAKLIEIREYYYLGDYFLYNFLKEDYKTMIDYVSDLFLNEKFKDLDFVEVIKNRINILPNTSTFEKRVFANYKKNRKDENKEFASIFSDDEKLYQLEKLLSAIFFNEDFIMKFKKTLVKRRGSEIGKRFGL
jgi:hypothetical protein